jgi:hypothetical protein
MILLLPLYFSYVDINIIKNICFIYILWKPIENNRNEQIYDNTNKKRNPRTLTTIL